MTISPRSVFAACVGPQKKPVIERSLLLELTDVAVLENQACARKVEIAAAIWDSCIHQNVAVGDVITDAGNYAASETAKVLGCSKTVADTYAEIGMDLRLRMPAVKAAFDAGELDLPRVRAIYRTTNALSLDAAERIESETLNAARRLSPGPLATEVSAIMQRTAPDEAAEIRKDLKKLTRVRYRDRDLIATIEADLEAADAAACWQLINEMADTLCRRDPRTRGQRLAAAYTASMHKESYVRCTCEIDEDNPCTAQRELPDRRTPLTTVTVDLATLLGQSNSPGYLAGHGLIDAEYARTLAASGDLQILLVEAMEIAKKLGLLGDGELSNTTVGFGGAAGRAEEAGSDDSTGLDDADGTDNAAGSAASAESTGPGRPPGDEQGAARGNGDVYGAGSDNGKAGRDGDRTASESGNLEPSSADESVHLTFNPLGRGRRRKGLKIVKQTDFGANTGSDADARPSSNAESTTDARPTGDAESSSNAQSGSDPESGSDAGHASRSTEEYRGSYTFIARLEAAIAADPSLAETVHSDGHGGFVEPPAGALTYRPTRELAECVRQRDRTCRHPGCDVPSARCEIDHVVPYRHRAPKSGGWTVLTNLHCLCRYHHMLKTMGVWVPVMLAGGVDFWTSSSGTTAVTLPGNVIGTDISGSDLPGNGLIPWIPRKRRAKLDIENDDTEGTDERTGLDRVRRSPAPTRSSGKWAYTRKPDAEPEGGEACEEPAPF